MNLFKASNQWATRPPDERFESIEALYQATKAYAAASAERPDVEYSTLRTEADKGEVMLVGKGNVAARFTHFSFGQLARYIGAPAEYLRGLPATLAVQNMNHGLKANRGDGQMANLLFHKNGSLLIRSIMSNRYNRFWNWEVAERLLNSKGFGWRVPPARPAFPNQPGTRKATAADVLDIKNSSGLSVNIGDQIAPAGVYASDHDMFVFLVNEKNRVQDGSEFGLSRGIFVSNSEVGGASLRVTRFLYRSVCGNHIVWDAKDVKEIAIRHVGHQMDSRITAAFEAELTQYSNESVSDIEAKIKQARKMLLGKTKEEVLDMLFGKRLMSRTLAEKAYDAVVPEVDGDPNSVYGLVQGATRVSQLTPYMDERNEIDRQSAKILALAF